MNAFNIQQIEKIISQYNPEHDIDSSPTAPPVTWREERLATGVLELYAAIEELKKQMNIFMDLLDK